MSNLSNKHIIVADDEKNTRKTLQIILSREGWRVTMATNGHETVMKILALQILADPPRLLLIDLFIPGLSGFQVLEVLNRRRINMPLIAMTGNVQADTVAKLRACGCHHLLTKPFGPEDLMAAISSALEESDTGSQLELTRHQNSLT